MWRTLADWLLAVLNMTRELEDNRAAIRRLETRFRDLEEVSIVRTPPYSLLEDWHFGFARPLLHSAPVAITKN